MRLALVITSTYAENSVVPNREAFKDTADLFAERIGVDEAGFEVRRLPASRDLPEALEGLLRDEAGKVESLLVHFSGYVAVKADRGPALLLDGNRLRAFPLSRLRAALEEGAQQSLVILDGLAVVDTGQTPSTVAKTVSDALVSADGTITALVGIEEEFATERRGAYRLTDLFTLSLGHLAKKARGGILSSTAVYQSMQGEVLSFASIPGLEHRGGYFDFVVLEGPGVGGIPDAPFSNERVTQPVAVFQPQVPSLPSIQSLASEASLDQLPLQSETEVRNTNTPPDEPEEQEQPASVREDELIREETPATDSSDAVPNEQAQSAAEEGHLPLAGLYDVPISRSPDGRCPTLAETPEARATNQRDWVAEAAYFPSAPPPRVSTVAAIPMRHPQATDPGVGEESTEFPPEPRPTPVSSRPSRPSIPPTDPAIAASSKAVITLYEELLENLDASEDPRRAEVHAKLGDALRDTQRRAEALFAYERSLDIDPHQEQAFDGACSLYREDGDYTGLVSTIRRKLQATEDDSSRLSLYDLIVHVWLNEAGDVERAIETLEEKLNYAPDDIDTLERLIDAQDRRADLFGRIESRERLARLANANPELRAALWVEAATIAHDELDDLARTFIALEYAIDLGVRLKGSLDATEALLGGRERWLEVIELYERALEVETDTEQAVAIAWRLVQLVLEQSAQDALKPDSLSALIRLSSFNRTLAEAVGSLVRAQTIGPETLDVVQNLRVADPRNLQQLHFLFNLSQSEHLDVAANVASVLSAEGAANERESEFALWLTADSLPTPQRGLENADYDSLLFPADFDRDLTLTLDKLDPALIAADVFGLKSAAQLPKDTPIFDPETSTVTLARSFLWASRLLSVQIPELAMVSDAALPLKLIPQEHRPRIVVDKSLASGLGLPELAFLAARHSALLLPGFTIRDHSADPRMLGSALFVLAAIANSGSRGLKTLGEYEQKVGKRLLSQLDKNDTLMADLQRFFGGVEPTQGQCEDRAFYWLRGVDQIRLRVALLACGCPATALKLNREFSLDGPFTPEEQLDLLAAFAGSPEHCELRSRLGMLTHQGA